MGPGVRTSRTGPRWRITRPLHPGLRPSVLSYVGYRDSLISPYRVRLVPTARAVVLINLAEPFAAVRRSGVPDAHSGRIGSLAVGMEDRPAICEHPGGQEAIRVEFTPLGAYQLFAVPMSELTNHVVELRDVLGPRSTELIERLSATRDWSRRFDLLDRALLDRLARGPLPAPEVGHAWRLLTGAAGALPIHGVASEVGWSQKHLSRRFAAQVGLTPKRAARVLRFRRALDMLVGKGCSAAETAALCGYFDQAHLVREFRALGDVSPGQLLSTRRAEGALIL